MARLEHPERLRLRKIDTVAAKGKREALTLYEVLDALPSDLQARVAATPGSFEAGRAAHIRGDLATSEGHPS